MKTHQSVLPQRAALESEPADNTGSKDETGFGDRFAVPGMEHVRGETVSTSPGADGVTPESTRAGEKVRECHPWVFVLDKRGQPLQPTTPARARKLLEKGRAAVARHTPFVIRLKDRVASESEIDGVEIGIDPGSKHTGISIFTVDNGERRARFAIQLDHRGALIRKKLQQRANYRRSRRVRNLRYRAPRFFNRTRPDGWLTPSLQHRVDTTIAWVDRLSQWAPLLVAHVESVTFDTHQMSAGRNLENTEYQLGTLQGFETREYLLSRWRRTCAYCGARNTPLNVDHVKPRSRGGSDRISNLVIACIPCNQEKGNRQISDFLARNPDLLARIKAQAKAPLNDAAATQSIRNVLLGALRLRMRTREASGGRTKWNRSRCRLPKTHTLDALAVGELETITEVSNQVLVVGCTGRGSYARTRSNKYGFPRLHLPRHKQFHGFATGDLVRAVIRTGKKRGAYTGRVSVRASGSFNISIAQQTIQGLRHKHFRLLQRADGYTYTRKGEGVSFSA